MAWWFHFFLLDNRLPTLFQALWITINVNQAPVPKHIDQQHQHTPCSLFQSCIVLQWKVCQRFTGNSSVNKSWKCFPNVFSPVFGCLTLLKRGIRNVWCNSGANLGTHNPYDIYTMHKHAGTMYHLFFQTFKFCKTLWQISKASLADSLHSNAVYLFVSLMIYGHKWLTPTEHLCATTVLWRGEPCRAFCDRVTMSWWHHLRSFFFIGWLMVVPLRATVYWKPEDQLQE